jgi:hypothetical protein
MARDEVDLQTTLEPDEQERRKNAPEQRLLRERVTVAEHHQSPTEQPLSDDNP